MNHAPSPDLSPKATTHEDVCLGRGEGFGFVVDGNVFSLSLPTTDASRMMNFGERAGVRGQPKACAS